MTVLLGIDQERQERDELPLLATWCALRQASAAIIPRQTAWVFRSPIQGGSSCKSSKADIVLADIRSGWSLCCLQAELGEGSGRPVGQLILGEICFRDRIEQEGKRWMS
ncbi:MAG: hypothetical protein NTV14_01705 [Coprothermobacterota bacterium]|nr:hypothetical protein [Coprothermobacterota bacterium]